MKTAKKLLLAVNLLLMAAVFTGNYFFLTFYVICKTNI